MHSDPIVDPGTHPTPRQVWQEVLALFAASMGLTLLILVLGRFIPIIQQNALALVAVVFIYLPTLALRRRGQEPSDVGLTGRGALPGIRTGLLLTLFTLPFFWIGFHGWETVVFGHRLELGLDNYRTWPDQLRIDPPQEQTEGLTLWRNQRNLVLSWDGAGPWRIRLETNGRLVHLGGPQPRVPDPTTPDGTTGPVQQVEDPQAGSNATQGPRSRVDQADPHQVWEIETSRGGYDLAFMASGGNDLWIYPYRQGRPLDNELVRFGQSTPNPEDGFPIHLRRGLWWIALWILVQLLLVALPEEYFYRGFIQTRLASVYPAKWRFWVFHLSPPIVLTSALFALGHFAIGLDPQRLAVFFPSLLFGWLRDKTGSLVAGIVFHAACNLMVQFTIVHYWPV